MDRQQRFRENTKILADRIQNLDEALVFAARDLVKIANGVVPPQQAARFARQTLKGIALIALDVK